MNIAKAVAELEKAGIKLSKTQQEALAETLEKEFREAAEKRIAEKVSTDDEKARVATAEEWAERLFTLAEDVTKTFVSKTRNQGRGRILEYVLGATGNEIETPNGRIVLTVKKTVESE